MKPDLELLSTIRPAEVSPYLFTRIKQRVNALQANKLSPWAAWTIVTVTIAILLINISLIRITDNPIEKHSDQTMLSSSNNLYNE